MTSKNLARILPLAALPLLGCGSLAPARTAVDATVAVYNATKGAVEQQYEQQYEQAQLACLEAPQTPPETCVAQVRAAWKPAKNAEVAFYRALLLAQHAVGIAEAGSAVGKRPDLPQVMAAVAAAIQAGEALRDAVRDLQKPAAGGVK